MTVLKAINGWRNSSEGRTCAQCVQTRLEGAGRIAGPENKARQSAPAHKL